MGMAVSAYEVHTAGHDWARGEKKSKFRSRAIPRESRCRAGEARFTMKASFHRERRARVRRYAITTGTILGVAPFSASQNWCSFTTSMQSS
jgi:hypothetical protein